MLGGRDHGCLIAGRIVAREKINLMMGTRRDFIFSTKTSKMEVRSLEEECWSGGLRDGDLLAVALAYETR